MIVTKIRNWDELILDLSLKEFELEIGKLNFEDWNWKIIRS